MKPFISLVLCVIFAFVNTNEAKSITETPKPQNVKVESLSSSSLRVTWAALSKDDWDGELAGYHIRIWEPTQDTDPRSIMKTVSCDEENCSDITNGFDAFTKYTFTVQAYNSEDSGPESDEVSQYTAEDNSNEGPTGVKCETLSSDEIRVSWDSLPLESLHGTFKGYKVDFKEIDENIALAYDQIGQFKISNNNKTILNGLKPKAEYIIRVFATTSDGEDISSSRIYCTTESDVPSEPIDIKVIVKETEKVLVLWHPPLRTSGHILNYTIYYRIRDNEPKTGRVLANETSYEICGLEPYESYEFWVKASNLDGEGQASDYVTKTISSETAPQIATYASTFTVKFNKGIKLPCVAFGSPTPNVTWKVNGDNLVLNERIEILFTGSLIIKSAIREDANNYTCFAWNEFGNDSITYELLVEAPPKSPEITILSTTTDKIVLKLKPNSTDSVLIQGFDLYYKLDSEIEQWKKKNVDVNSQSIIIDHCKCGSPYLFYAIGHNDLGDGEPSETITVRIKGSKPSAPEMANFIKPSTESVTLHFRSWNGNDCPISHFFVEFKKREHNIWTKNRTLRRHTDFVLNLEPTNLYDIRVTAHNVAGSTIADYEVVTLTQHEVPGAIATDAPVTLLKSAENKWKQI